MVEFAKYSREFLSKNIVVQPFINLEKTKDFLEYIPSNQYDYIYESTISFKKKYKYKI